MPERTVELKSSIPFCVGEIVYASGHLKHDVERWVISDRNEIVGYDPAGKGHMGGSWSREQRPKWDWYPDKIKIHQAQSRKTNEVEIAIDGLFEVLKQEALEDGNPLPQQSVLDKVRQFITEMGESPDELELDLFDDGSIGTTKRGAFGCSVMIVCKPDGTAIAALSEKGEYHHLFSSSTDYRPDIFARFLADVLRKMEKENIDVVVPNGDQR